MSEKSGRSEEKTDWLGNKHTQHYDADGNKCGWSEEKEDIWSGGDKYTQHHDQGDNKAGWSEEKTSLFGNKYTQHYDTDDKRVDVAESKYNDEENGNTGSDETNNYSTHLNNYSSSKNESSSGKKIVWVILIFGITLAIFLIIKTTNNKNQSTTVYKKTVISQANKSVIESTGNQNKKQLSNDNILSGDEVKTFIEKWVNLSNKKGSIDEIMQLYADKVDFWDKGFLTKDFIRQEIISIHKMWPQWKYRLSSSIMIIPGNTDNEKTAKYTVYCIERNDQKTIEGDVYVETTLQKQENRILVIREKGKIRNQRIKDNLDHKRRKNVYEYEYRSKGPLDLRGNFQFRWK